MVMMSVEQSMIYLAGETKALGENLPQSRFVHTMTMTMTMTMTRAR
jgi:hypothetical protein